MVQGKKLKSVTLREKLFVFVWLGIICTFFVNYALSNSAAVDIIYAWRLTQSDDELLEFTTQEATTEKQTKAPNRKYVKTEVVESGKYTGGWPITEELPVSQRRDTSCPMTLVKERMNLTLLGPDVPKWDVLLFTICLSTDNFLLLDLFGKLRVFYDLGSKL